MTTVAGGPPSLYSATLRRSFTTGRFFLVYGCVVSSLLGVALAGARGGSFSASFPLLLPIFAVVGSMGGLVIFANDRLKGVLEYLLAYGMTPRRIFLDVLQTALTLTAIVLSVAIALGVGVFVARGHSLTLELGLLLAAYAIPMSFASSAFAATVGMYWTSLSSPRSGMNSPIGLVPLVGILPAVATLAVIAGLGIGGQLSPDRFVAVALGAAGLVALTVGILLLSIDRLLRREKLLSPA